jgi:hypothetical protein
MAAEAIERFSGPPLAERAWISEQARSCVVRPGTDDLQTLVERDLRDHGNEGLAWDAWRRSDGRWTVVAAVGTDAPISTWVYDPRSRSVHPDDAASHRLASEDVVVPLRGSTSTTAQTSPDDVDDAPEQAPDPVPAHAHASEASDEASPTDVPQQTRAKSRKGRRASVPRWDEILFGSGEADA